MEQRFIKVSLMWGFRDYLGRYFRFLRVFRIAIRTHFAMRFRKNEAAARILRGFRVDLWKCISDRKP